MSLLKASERGQFYTLELPEQQAVNKPSIASGRSWVLPPVTAHVFLQGKDRDAAYALDNAFDLLKVAFDHEVVELDLLRLILRATGHHESKTSSFPAASASPAPGSAEERVPHED